MPGMLKSTSSSSPHTHGSLATSMARIEAPLWQAKQNHSIRPETQIVGQNITREAPISLHIQDSTSSPTNRHRLGKLRKKLAGLCL